MHWQFVLLLIAVVCAIARGDQVPVGRLQQLQQQQQQQQDVEFGHVDRSKPRDVLLSADHPRIQRQKEINKQTQQQFEEQRRQHRQPGKLRHQQQQQQQSGPIPRQPVDQHSQKDGVTYNYDQTMADFANWTEACGSNKPQILDSFDGEITSPYYPQTYPPDLNCQWRILSQLDNSQMLYIEFRELRLYWEDCVAISPFNNSNGWYDYKSCGSDHVCYVPFRVMSNSPDTNFTFSSSSSPNVFYPGFKLLYSSETACYNSRNLAPALSGSFWSLYLPWDISTSSCNWYYNNGYDVEMIVTFGYFNLSEICGSYHYDYGYLQICDNYECRTYYQNPGTLYIYGNNINFYHYLYSDAQPGHGFNATFEIVGNSTRMTSSTTTSQWGGSTF